MENTFQGRRFSSEAVSAGHPDKVADQISDALLDHYLAFDPHARVALETLVTKNNVVVAGEVLSSAQIDLEAVVRATIRAIGYNNLGHGFDAATCKVQLLVQQQSSEINQAVEAGDGKALGAGDQGIMFGYATNQSPELLPLSYLFARDLLRTLERFRVEGILPYLLPDAKSQVTILQDGTGKPIAVETVVLSTQHLPISQEQLQQDVVRLLIPAFAKDLPPAARLIWDKQPINYHINPSGSFTLGGPAVDTGLTGRKIIVDTYGGHGAHGGGAFSGKDPSKVDRSAAYMARYIARSVVAAELADELLVQLSYAIGLTQPVGLYLDARGTEKVDLQALSNWLQSELDLSPAGIIAALALQTPKYLPTASHGHFGRAVQVLKRTFVDANGYQKQVEVELFSWENDLLKTKLQQQFRGGAR
jgi:S-adenosylmethionine synthetase